MKKNRLLLAVVLLISGLSTTVKAQTSATVNGTTAGAKLIVPMTLTERAPLHFGTINLLSSAPGTVILPSDNTSRSFTGGAVASSVAPLATNAAFDVAGTKNVTYALTLPSAITVTETVLGTASMTINDLKARFVGNPGADATTSVLSATGTDSFKIGGTLIVAASQIGGIYAGTFNVSVDYN